MGVGNIYGLDIKLTNADNGVKPVLIEMNGTDSGTNSFSYDEGFAYYDTFVRVLSAQAKGKPIFIEKYSKRPIDGLEAAMLKAELDRELKDRKEMLSVVSDELGSEFEFDYSWLDDLHRFRVEKLQALDDSEDKYYEYAAKKEKVKLFVFRDISYGSNSIEFILNDGSRIAMRPEDIGIIRSVSHRLYECPEQYAHLFLNSPVLETIMDSKPITRYFGSVLGRMYNCFPEGMTVGLGLGNNKELLEFLSELDSELVVRKRGSSYCGTGVEILERSKIMEILVAKGTTPSSTSISQTVIGIMRFIVNGVKLEEYLSLYEGFVPSIPIFNPKTGKFHDGCARAIVYCHPGEKPIVIDSQWRVSIRPMDEAEGTLEDKFRVNLSRGATAMKIEPEQKAMIHEFAYQVVEKMENGLASYRKLSGDKKMDKAGLIRLMFWKRLMTHDKRAAMDEFVRSNPNDRFVRELGIHLLL